MVCTFLDVGRQRELVKVRVGRVGGYLGLVVRCIGFWARVRVSGW